MQMGPKSCLISGVSLFSATLRTVTFLDPHLSAVEKKGVKKRQKKDDIGDYERETKMQAGLITHTLNPCSKII